ncbi:CDK-activating kinase assembly factor MAT1-domain-containing protein [Mrakia frigida]|uniref:CDK-activating kinase assembly factor MAT1-domain-containing protein n=1 Tax=Mrakia frigida TaxID=29902 RepID=UPI003FCC08D5
MSTPRLGWLKSSAGSSSKRSNPGTPRASTSSVQHLSSTASTSTAVYKDDKNRVAAYETPEDQCPICKSDRYLNPKLRLLVSSTCYHKMCESCIERLFTLGPAPCPTCNVILRKSGFKLQTFEDLRVEEEVAIRRRIAKNFNKRAEDFEDTRAYNDYLEEVEDITFNLLNQVSLPQTEARIAAFAAANAEFIDSNALLDEEERERVEEEEKRAKEERDWRREQGRKEGEEKEKEKKILEEKLLKELEFSSADPSAILSKLSAAASASTASLQPTAPPPPSFVPRLRRSAATQAPAGPPPPYKDPYDSYETLYTMMESYDDPSTARLREDKDGTIEAGGWSVQETWERAVKGAVAGLGTGVRRGL